MSRRVVDGRANTNACRKWSRWFSRRAFCPCLWSVIIPPCRMKQSTEFRSMHASDYQNWVSHAVKSSTKPSKGMSSNSSHTCPPNLPPSTIHSSTSRYALSKSSLTTTLSCTPSSFENSISLAAWSSLFFKLSSSSVPRPRKRCSSTSREGGDRKRKRACSSVRLTCLTPYIT